MFESISNKVGANVTFMHIREQDAIFRIPLTSLKYSAEICLKRNASRPRLEKQLFNLNNFKFV